MLTIPRNFTFLLSEINTTAKLTINRYDGREATKIIQDGASQYRGADKSLARPTFPCILFDGENISFDASLVTYINSTNIPPIMIINWTYETRHLLSL